MAHCHRCSVLIFHVLPINLWNCFGIPWVLDTRETRSKNFMNFSKMSDTIINLIPDSHIIRINIEKNENKFKLNEDPLLFDLRGREKQRIHIYKLLTMRDTDGDKNRTDGLCQMSLQWNRRNLAVPLARKPTSKKDLTMVKQYSFDD